MKEQLVRIQNINWANHLPWIVSLLITLVAFGYHSYATSLRVDHLEKVLEKHQCFEHDTLLDLKYRLNYVETKLDR